MTRTPVAVRRRPADAARGPGRSGGGRWWRAPARILLLVGLMWGLLLVIGCSFQERLIFPGPRVDADRLVPDGIEPVWIEAEPGVRVEGWFAPGKGRTASSPGPAVMVFHGNAELIDHAGFDIALYRPLGISVLACEYRGYGRSGGQPSQAGIAADAIAFRAWLDARPEVDASRVMYHGRSLGGAVVVDLARTRRPAALVLTSTFTSMRAMFARSLVPGFLCRHPFRTDESLAAITAEAALPVLLVHGDVDRVVPVSHGRRLAADVPGATWLELPGEGHVLPLHLAVYRDPVRAFVAEALGLTATAPSGTSGGSGAVPATP